MENNDTPQVAQPVNLTLGDLKLLSNIIDVASNRGAYKAAEFTTVGEIYDKLNGFIAQAEAENPQPTEAE